MNKIEEIPENVSLGGSGIRVQTGIFLHPFLRGINEKTWITIPVNHQFWRNRCFFDSREYIIPENCGESSVSFSSVKRVEIKNLKQKPENIIVIKTVTENKASYVKFTFKSEYPSAEFYHNDEFLAQVHI